MAPLPMCRGPNLASPDGRRIAAETAATGLEALPHMAEIYPLGGEPRVPCRLQCSPAGKSNPASLLPACLPALELSHAACSLHGLSVAMGSSPALPAAWLVHLYGNIDPTLLSGAGDRLGLTCSVTGEGLPVAVLPYCGRPLLESLIRDVQVSPPECLVFKCHAGRYALAAFAAATC